MKYKIEMCRQQKAKLKAELQQLEFLCKGSLRKVETGGGRV
jgi:hypothetical protein